MSDLYFPLGCLMVEFAAQTVWQVLLLRQTRRLGEWFQEIKRESLAVESRLAQETANEKEKPE